VCNGDGSCVVTAQGGGSPGGSGSSGSSGGGASAEVCSWQPESAQAAQVLLDSGVPPPLVNDGSAGPDDSWYLATCVGGPVGIDSVVYLVEAAPGALDMLTPAEVAQIAVSDLDLAAPTVSMAPFGKAIVNLESWLWIDPADWQPITATATAGGITATATATPQYVVWDMGDGNQVTCDSPGVAYNTSIPDQDQTTSCGYTYQETSANRPDQQFTITTTIAYDVTWTSVGVAGGGDLGIVPGASTTTAVTVDEIGTVTVPNPQR
jgi:hypothetical protein